MSLALSGTASFRSSPTTKTYRLVQFYQNMLTPVSGVKRVVDFGVGRVSIVALFLFGFLIM